MPNQLIDNHSHTLASAINAIAPHASAGHFAVGYFFLSGFTAVVDAIKGLDRLQLLIGTTTNRQTVEQLALGYRRRELIEEKLRAEQHAPVGKAMEETAAAIRRHISELQPGEREEHTIVTLADLIAKGKIDVRIYTRGVLHAKAYIFDYRVPQPNSRGIGIVGSSNLTEPGLTSNTELNVQVDDDANILTSEGLHRDLCEWFDNLWAEAKPFTVELMRELQESWALAVAHPYDVYLKMLFEIVRGRLEDDATKLVLPEEIPLAAYQKVAVHQAIGMVKTYRGAFVADVVGVGKSFIGSAVARHFYEAERRRPLIVCPKNLEPMWEDYNRRWHLNAEIVPLSMLREIKGEDGTLTTELDKDKYQDCGFVLVDESHNLRYSDNDRYRVLNQYLADGVDRKVLLMTATPYNKTNWDVYNQVKLFHHEESTRIPVEPRNLREYFRRVERGERRLQDLLVHMLVRRTRWQLLRWYGYDEQTDKAVEPTEFGPYLREERRAYLKFTSVEGIEDKKFFPYRRLRTVEYCVDDVYGQEYGKSLYAEIVKMLHRQRGTNLPLHLIPDDEADAEDPRALTYGRYGLFNYVWPEKRGDQRYLRLIRAGKNLRGLIRTSLFKRLESSVESFRKSIDRQVLVHKNFLTALNNDKIAAGPSAVRALEDVLDDTDEALQAFMDSLAEAEQERGFVYDINDFRVDDLRKDIEHDVQTLEYIQSLVARDKIPSSKDAKLQKFLLDLLPTLMRNKKLLVFTQYEDTARYIWDNLPAKLKEGAYLVTGDTENLQDVVKRFAPVANPDRNGGAPRSKAIDLLITTDRLAEGLNLQDCSQVLNYDLHWNPVRLIQRFGRIDRIGSKYDEIYALNFLPEKEAEKQLGLRGKLTQRIKEFNEILGMDSQVLDEKERINPEAVYAIYEETSGRHLGRFEGEDTLIGATLAEAEEFFRDLRERNPEEYERIRNLRDGLRTARQSTEGAGKVLVLGKAGDFLRLYVRDLKDQPVDIDTMEALRLSSCSPDEPAAEMPANLNRVLTGVKLRLEKDVDDLWAQRKTRSNLTAGQRYVLDQLEKLRRERPVLDADGGIGKLSEAVSRTRQKRFQTGCDRVRRNQAVGEMLLRRVRQLYYDCGLHLERAADDEEEIEQRIPRIVAVYALV